MPPGMLDLTGRANPPLHGFDQIWIWMAIVQLALDLTAWMPTLAAGSPNDYGYGSSRPQGRSPPTPTAPTCYRCLFCCSATLFIFPSPLVPWFRRRFRACCHGTTTASMSTTQAGLSPPSNSIVTRVAT